MANRIHLRRVNGIYVDPKTAELPERIPDSEVAGMITLAEYCVLRERTAVFQDVDEKHRADFEWYMKACDDPKLAGVIFGRDSFAQLKSFGGNIREWVPWLRAEIDRLDEHNRRLEEEESKRVPPANDQALNAKWKFKVRLHSWSHSVRGKALSSWNKKSPSVKLTAAHDRRELVVEFLFQAR